LTDHYFSFICLFTKFPRPRDILLQQIIL